MEKRKTTRSWGRNTEEVAPCAILEKSSVRGQGSGKAPKGFSVHVLPFPALMEEAASLC